jgi:hypothetical protein
MSLDRSKLQIEDSTETETTIQSKDNNMPIEHEIECLPCQDIMVPSSQFDRLCYLCEECSFSLYLSY